MLHRDTLFKSNAAYGLIEAAYDVMPKSGHFIMLAPAATISSPNMVLGWADEVRAKVAGAAKK